VTSNAPLRGGKSQLYEGGIRVPMIVRWPNSVSAAAVCDQPTMNVDFYPTLLEAARIATDPSQMLDGVSTLATWKQPKEVSGRNAMYWHYPLDRPHFLGGKSAGAIRDGNWKLIENFDTGRAELYSLADDRSEQRDLAAEHPARVSDLKAKLAAWRHEVGARVPSPPLLVDPRKLYFADHFSPGQVSDRWFFSRDWSAEDGVLQHSDAATDAGRIFLKGAAFQDVMIRFDFQFQNARDIRLITGGSGHYNAVVHIQRDHFYVQTALDPTGPYFSYRHGECAYEFDEGRWYTLTVEFIGDELVAHIDHDHLAYARHPILDRERDYFAFQVDDASAAFDNVQILQAVKHASRGSNLAHIEAVSGRYPVPKSTGEQFAIQKSNAHEWLYQRHEAYRKLVKRVDELDERNERAYPDVFRSHKEFQDAIAAERKKLHAEDPEYKETLFATYRADRAIDAFLIAQQPDVGELPDSRRKREIERLRVRHQNDRAYLKLVAQRDAAQVVLERSYPQLFRTDADITEFRNEQRKSVQDDPAFRELIDERAAAYRAQQAYLFEHDAKLAELQRLLAEEQ